MLVPVEKELSLGGAATLSSGLDLTDHFPSQYYGPVAFEACRGCAAEVRFEPYGERCVNCWCCFERAAPKDREPNLRPPGFSSPSPGGFSASRLVFRRLHARQRHLRRVARDPTVDGLHLLPLLGDWIFRVVGQRRVRDPGPRGRGEALGDARERQLRRARRGVQRTRWCPSLSSTRRPTTSRTYSRRSSSSSPSSPTRSGGAGTSSAPPATSRT